MWSIKYKKSWTKERKKFQSRRFRKLWADRKWRKNRVRLIRKNAKRPEWRTNQRTASRKSSQRLSVRRHHSRMMKLHWNKTGARKRHGDRIKRNWKNKVWVLKEKQRREKWRKTAAYKKACLNHSLEMFNRWRDPVYRKRLLPKIFGLTKRKGTAIEIAVLEEMQNRGIKGFEAQYCVSETRCVPDFAFAKLKLAIFCDGGYWHSKPEIYNKDRRVNKRLTKLGWKVLRFSEKRIKRDVEEVVDRIQKCVAELSGEELIIIEKKGGISRVC